jgi:hypothetical protein
VILGANFDYIDITELSDHERSMIDNDKDILDKGGYSNAIKGSKYDSDLNFDKNISGKYVRLKTGMYKGYIGRVSVCPEGTTPCNVKVAINLCLFVNIPIFFCIEKTFLMSIHLRNFQVLDLDGERTGRHTNAIPRNCDLGNLNFSMISVFMYIYQYL